MMNTAKIFTNGRSQAVRLPAAFRFDVAEVYVRQDPTTGDVILSRRPQDWGDFVQALQGLEVPADFLSAEERAGADGADGVNEAAQGRDPLEGLG